VKKKLLFMLINMNIGGTEKALLNLISDIPKEEYEISILMLEEYGGFLKYIPKDVNIEYVKDYDKIKSILNQPPQMTIFNLLKMGKLVNAITILLIHLLSKVTKERSIFFKYILKDYSNIETEYDVAVAYAGPMDFISYFILHKVKAKKKVQWIHFDISKIGFNQRFAFKIYNKFHKIFVVSDEARSNVIAALPTLQGKTDVFLNIISKNEIYEQALEGNSFDDDFDGIRILTVGRLAIEKGQDLSIQVLAKLIKNGYKVRWYCIGEGNAREVYEELIKKYNLQNHFFLLGANPNPYPFIKQCDIYVQSSRHEGYCITLTEARLLNKPIITTAFIGAREQIRDGETGIITGFNEDGLYTAITKLLSDRKLRDTFSNNLNRELLNNTSQLEKLFNLF
jgi:glycosyltransferase involved in cell wall biosynthesis